MACGPLHGVKVIECAHMLSGPYCCQILGDLGASVIKVESTGAGDRTRGLHPFSDPGGVSYGFLSRNRNKRSACVDLGTDEGREVMYRLVRDADVLVHNLRRTTMAGLKLAYSDLKQVNPRLVYASISGFGEEGPYRDLPGEDMQAQAMSGILSIIGYPDLSSTPVGTQLGDSATGIVSALGVVGALYARDRTGQGQEVTNSLLASLMAIQPAALSYYLATGVVQPKMGPAGSPTLPVPYGVWTAGDGKEIAISSYRDWPKFCQCIGMPGLAEDPRFDTYENRQGNRRELVDIIQEALSKRDRDEWIPLLREHEQWVVPVRDYQDIFSDTDAWDNGLVAEMEHPLAGPVRTFGAPLKFSDTPKPPSKYPPVLGEDTRQVLLGASYSESEIDGLYRKGSVK